MIPEIKLRNYTNDSGFSVAYSYNHLKSIPEFVNKRPVRKKQMTLNQAM